MPRASPPRVVPFEAVRPRVPFGWYGDITGDQGRRWRPAEGYGRRKWWRRGGGEVVGGGGQAQFRPASSATVSMQATGHIETEPKVGQYHTRPLETYTTITSENGFTSPSDCDANPSVVHIANGWPITVDVQPHPRRRPKILAE